MEDETMPQGDEGMVDEILSLVEQLLQTAGPEWVMEFLQGGIEAAGQGGEPEMMSQGGPSSMPPMSPQKPRNAFAQ